MMRARIGVVGLVVFGLILTGCDALISPQHRISRARADIASGEWGAAAIELRKVVQAHPGNAEAWLLLATLSLDSADVNDARAALDHAGNAGAKGPKLDQLRARVWLAVGQPQPLIDALTRGALAIPEPDRTIALARAYNELSRPDRALAALQPILATHPQLTEARLAAGEALAREGKSDEALRQVAAARASDPHSYAAPLLQGQILERRGDFRSAEQAFTASEQAMPLSAQLSDRVACIAGLTESQVAEGKIDQAARAAEPIVTLLPDSPAVQVLSARIKLARRDFVGGIADLEKAVANAPNFVQARMLLGAAQLERGDLEQARIQLMQVVQLSPENIEARKLLAAVRLKLGQPEDALRILTPALAEHASDPQLFSMLGAAEQRIGNSNEVIEALEHAVRAHPADRNLQLDLAQAYLAANRAADALSILEQVPDVGNDVRRDALLVLALDAARGVSAATAEVDKLLAAHPNDRSTLSLGASYYASQRQFDRARVLLRRALVIDSRDVGLLTSLARMDLAAGDQAGAESDLRTALGIAPESLAVRIEFADVLAHKGAFADAQKLLESASPRSRANPNLYFALAQVQLARGDMKQADAALDRAVALAPVPARALDTAGKMLLDARRYDAALSRFRRAADTTPDNADFWLDTARVQLALNHPEAARESLEKASQLQPQWVPAVSGLVLIDLSDKNIQSALARVNALLAAHPDDPDALVLKGDTEVALGRPPDALTAYESAQRRRPTSSVAVKVFRARLATGGAHPEEPLERWLALDPSDAGVHGVLGDFYLSKRDLKRAAREYQTASELVPDNVVSLNNLAWTYLELDDPRAESVAEHAYKLAPQAAGVEDTLGWILVRKHAVDRALPLLAEAVKAGSDPEIQYHYAYVLAQMGKRSEARDVLSKALATKQNFDSKRDAQRLLAELGA